MTINEFAANLSIASRRTGFVTPSGTFGEARWMRAGNVRGAGATHAPRECLKPRLPSPSRRG